MSSALHFVGIDDSMLPTRHHVGESLLPNCLNSGASLLPEPYHVGDSLLHVGVSLLSE